MLQNKNQEVTVQVSKLSTLGISTNETLFGIFLTCLGLTVYYFLPFCFIKKQYDFGYMIISGILISIVLGVTMMLVLVYEKI